MKKIIKFIIVSVLLLTFLPPVFAGLNDGLVVDYPFDGNANDGSGNGNHGNVFGATLTADRSGEPESSFSLDGVDDSIRIPSNAIGEYHFGGLNEPLTPNIGDTNIRNMQAHRGETYYYGIVNYLWKDTTFGLITLSSGQYGPKYAGSSLAQTRNWAIEYLEEAAPVWADSFEGNPNNYYRTRYGVMDYHTGSASSEYLYASFKMNRWCFFNWCGEGPLPTSKNVLQVQLIEYDNIFDTRNHSQTWLYKVYDNLHNGQWNVVIDVDRRYSYLDAGSRNIWLKSTITDWQSRGLGSERRGGFDFIDANNNRIAGIRNGAVHYMSRFNVWASGEYKWHNLTELSTYGDPDSIIDFDVGCHTGGPTGDPDEPFWWGVTDYYILVKNTDTDYQVRWMSEWDFENLFFWRSGGYFNDVTGDISMDATGETFVVATENKIWARLLSSESFYCYLVYLVNPEIDPACTSPLYEFENIARSATFKLRTDYTLLFRLSDGNYLATSIDWLQRGGGLAKFRSNPDPYADYELEWYFVSASDIDDANDGYYFQFPAVPTQHTPVGFNVETSFYDHYITFDTVTAEGFTVFSTSSSGPVLSENFIQPCAPPQYFNVETTATYSGNIEICLTYDDTICDETDLQLLHYEGVTWLDVTDYPVDKVNNIICGYVSSLSPFVLASPANQPPVAICQEITVSTDHGVCTAIEASVDNGSYDPEGGSITLDQSPPAPYNLGPTDVNLTVTDDKSEADQCSGTVTVVDQEPPALTCPTPPVAECTSPAGAIVSFEATATDNCTGAPSINFAPASGSLFPIDSTSVTCTATDEAENISNCNFTVTVQDTTDPVISSVSVNPNVLWPSNHKMVHVTTSVTANDICDAEPACLIISVTSNEPINGTGGGDKAPDWEITGDQTVNLRAERSGQGDGRIYTITVECTDASGNTATETTEVTVPHDKGKKKKK